jgi:hypothetical protein
VSPRSVLALTTVLLLAPPRIARAGTYLDTAALLLDETKRSAAFVQAHLPDVKLADIAHQLAEARVKTARTVFVPRDVERAHPHLLLTLEISERAMAAAMDGEPLKFLRFSVQAREEERTFRAILAQQKFVVPELEKDKEKK